MAKVVWTGPALIDVDDIFRYLARASQSADVAARICDEIIQFAQDFLERLPSGGALVEQGRDFGAREIYKHGYRLIYVRRGEHCYIVRCIHSSRDIARELHPADWPLNWNPEDN